MTAANSQMVATANSQKQLWLTMARSSFVPFDADGVGIFDPVDDSFLLVDMQLRGGDSFSERMNCLGAVTAAHGRIVFALVHAAGLGIFNPEWDEVEWEEVESEPHAKKARTR